MAGSEDLIDFGVIETQKENIQSLPGGRSAKLLSSICSPLAAKKSPPLSATQNLKDTMRQEYEKELLAIDESDDPLDIYERYIKWTMDAYPAAQATAESNLLPLLERATKAFITSSHYKNDPRYLKMWLLYIRLFSDSPRETYAFLARHNIGETLALFYEEFAAWLEGAGRWTQAEEVYLSGIDHEARPAERLIRKFGEFQHRRETKVQEEDGPTSPALPTVRPALAAKVDPFASSASEENDPQARDRAAAARPSRPGRQKMSIFADGDEPAKPGSSDSNRGWDSIGSLSERKKENTREAKPWAGEKLNGGKKMPSGPKLMVFKDGALGKFNEDDGTLSIHDQQRTINQKTGRSQYVFVNLEEVYPDGDDRTGNEYCFEELRARHRGWLNRNWRKPCALKSERSGLSKALRPLTPLRLDEQTVNLEMPAKLSVFQDIEANKAPAKISIFQDTEVNKAPVKIPIFDDSSAPQKHDAAAKAAKKARKEERANRTRKIQVMEVRAEPQTIQTNLNSPAGPKLKKKKNAEATMTLHTREAMDEVYDLFNQTLSKVGEPASEDAYSQDESDDEEDDDDDYTSAGESTGTGRISGATSEYGDETEADFTESKTNLDVPGADHTHGSGWSDFTEVKELPQESQDYRDDEGVTTPISPVRTAETDSGDEGEDASPKHFPEGTGLSHRTFGPRGQNRLPFMTPIVEKTESSLGSLTVAAEKEYFATKTPCRKNNPKTPTIPEVDNDDLWSSRFQGLENEIDKENMKLSQPALPKPAKSKAPLETSRSHPAALKEPLREKTLKGPIIKDAQCNPIDEAIRQTILTQIQPPIHSYDGYFDHQGTASAKGSDIRKYIKAIKGKGDKTMSLISPPTLSLGTSRQYTVRRELGKGAFAPVYLVDSTAMDDDDDGDMEERKVRMGHGEFSVKRNQQEAIKMEDPPSPWEFYIIRQAKRRLGVSRPSESIVNAYEMHLYDDECYLVEEFRNQGTLLDLVNICRADGSSGGFMDEQLVMFFSIELFRTVEALHSKGLIHGDLKADNVLMRLNTLASENAWTSQYHREGTNGWNEKGVTLIDFGRGIDMKAFKPDVQFIADWKTSEADCAEMREMRPWTYQVDYHGLAGIVHSLLFGKYLETIAERGGTLGAGATRTYRIRESLKRYWQTEIWGEVFSLLLNPLMYLEPEEGRVLPLLQGLRVLREKMESYLEVNCEKGVGLKALLRRMETAIRDRRK